VDYDCAHGKITGPLTIKRDGSFSWRGTFTPEHGGPVRSDEAANNQPAIYSGSISGNTMTLNVKLAANNDHMGSYGLQKGSDGEVFKCR